MNTSLSKTDAAPAASDPQEVARTAYRLYEQRGGLHGRDLEDWLEAERLVAAEAAKHAVPEPAPVPPSMDGANRARRKVPTTVDDARNRIHKQSTPFRTAARSSPASRSR